MKCLRREWHRQTVAHFADLNILVYDSWFRALIEGRWPGSIGVPTGTGKTAVIQVWLLALAWSLMCKQRGIPRRLAWVVNRRVVVDQASDEALGIQEQIETWPDEDPVKVTLRDCSCGGELISVSTLRGQKADNRKWSRDPSRPAIIVGTVDMIGSRLLFRGYGDSKYWRHTHAGLLGVDTLIVNDETHLTPAFAKLLDSIEALSPARDVDGKSFRVLLLSATSQPNNRKPLEHSLAQDIGRNAHFRQVVTAEKRLQLHQANDEKAKLFELALSDPPPRTIVFVEQPEEARKLAERLEAKAGASRVELLTGTMRGLERDQLVEKPLFRLFLEPAPPPEPAWLVSTSAGEVGVNLTSERVITGLTTADHVIQRFGRLNRFGRGHGEAHVVWTDKQLNGRAESATLEYLRRLGGDISCYTLYQNPPPPECMPELPKIARLERRLIDLWSQTTASGNAVPPVEKWLHGQQDNVPETDVAWRTDVEYLTRSQVTDEEREQALKHYRVLPHERLKEPTYRIREKLEKIAEREPQWRGLVVRSDGTVEALGIREAAEGALEYALVLLPPGCGSIDRGMFSSAAAAEGVVFDVADARGGRERYFDKGPEGYLRLRDGADVGSVDGSLRLKFQVPIAAADGESQEGVLLYCTSEPKRTGTRSEVSLCDHLAAVSEKAQELADKLGLVALAADFACAGEYHDWGKSNPLWQRAMGGNVEKPLAKTTKPVAPRLLAGYRHELASTMEATRNGSSNLSLHLIASHHGWARPYFETKAYDRRALRASEAEALASAQRFGRLQQRWGAWGLAYLGAVFQAADAIESGSEEDADA